MCELNSAATTENVYPAEVEAALRQVEGVKYAAVIGSSNERWGATGCAFVQLSRDYGLSAADAEPVIRGAIASRLARFKQPAHILVVEVIPRTGSGKARKNLLRGAFLKSARSA